ncbi:cytochrome c oxidase subunit 3 [Roseibium salinum]|uniref:Cytochrome c oxidase subunit 3 n=1 Tax=Roseibium salinum TaxID=1604349 RepID=A0ABT3R5M4_9HYPH|nr:cytochrome c oxidase subunit 3 [Roseibium sp. DSM 29163]MCX2724355.1 cytochrome c oxidase subunit 3 [Roseibium sp. DSM 29163]
MSVILGFLLIVLCISGWWLSRQGIMSKPWLEQGAPAAMADPQGQGRRTARIGLGVFLAVIGALFAMFASAYFERMGLPDWRSFPLPRLLWVNTGMLIAGSVALQCALVDARGGAMAQARRGLVVAALSGLAFLAGQLWVWLQLVSGGLVVASGPAITFFYLLTGLHGLHILGGLVALASSMPGAWRQGESGRSRFLLRLELCTTYWHFLLGLWLVIVLVLTGWADEIIATCSQLLS